MLNSVSYLYQIISPSLFNLSCSRSHIVLLLFFYVLDQHDITMVAMA